MSLSPAFHAFRSTGLAMSVLAAVSLLAACSSVDLGPRYDPPPVRVPGAAPTPLPPSAMPPVAQSTPVPPPQPVPQPLPPIGSTAPMPRPPMGTPAPLDTPSADPNAHLVTLTTRMDGLGAVPPTRSTGSGQLDALYNASTRLLRWKTSWSGLSGAITGVQFHGPGEDGQLAPATLVWPAPFGPTYEGRATLTPQQAIDLTSGRWYINVMTSAYPSGEVRGQLRVVN